MLSPETDKKIYSIYLDWFQDAERDRRWNFIKDIPWNKTTRGNIPEELVSIVETFTGIELVLPDYITEMLHFHRKTRGMSWYIANWGYEESKHSLALEKWLIDSGSRTEDQLTDFQKEIFQGEYITHCRSARHAAVYTMIQELATCMSYVKLEKKISAYEDDALSKSLYFIFRDEMAHHKFNAEIVKIHMELDREGTLKEIINEFRNFTMPSTNLIPFWKEKDKIIRDQDVMNQEIFVDTIFTPILKSLEISKKEWKKLSREMSEKAKEENKLASV